jgi:hypothetical protein
VEFCSKSVDNPFSKCGVWVQKKLCSVFLHCTPYTKKSFPDWHILFQNWWGQNECQLTVTKSMLIYQVSFNFSLLIFREVWFKVLVGIHINCSMPVWNVILLVRCYKNRILEYGVQWEYSPLTLLPVLGKFSVRSKNTAISWDLLQTESYLTITEYWNMVYSEISFLQYQSKYLENLW